jgi:DNA-binding response OmpR family regulator
MTQSKGVVLLVEDQDGFRRIYQDVLNADGYFVLTATDGEEGLAMVKEKKPDLVLLDLGLPKIDGFEVLRRIREDPETKKIPVIIFSVMGEQKDIQKALEMGANDYTVKGFYTPRQILSKIKSVMTKADMKRNLTSYKLLVKPGREDAVKLQDEIGLINGYECPDCNVELVLEMFPDYVREQGHWFASHLVCPKCGKVV